MKNRPQLPIIPETPAPRGLGTFLLLAALGGIIGVLSAPTGERHTDITIGIAGYFVVVAAFRVWAWLQAGNAERALNRRNYEGALERADRALIFFAHVPWVDRARAAALGEMGLVSLTEKAHSHRVAALAHLGQRNEARTALKEMEGLFPESAATHATRTFLNGFQRGG